MPVIQGTTSTVMDPQTCLKTILKNKFQKLREAYSDNSLLPPRLCYQDLSQHTLSHLDQHDFRYVDKSDRQPDTRSVFKTAPLADVLTYDYNRNSSKRTVITVGVCGIGKTTTVQSCALEWAEEKRYHNIYLLFPLTFWELSLVKEEMSLIELLRAFYPKLKELDVSSLNENNVWFVLDGLDQYSYPLSFSCPAVSDATEVSAVNVLVTNLIRGNLLPNAHIWITTRRAAANQIPRHHLLKETELQGFSDEQKEQHFRAIIGNHDLANKSIDHVKISRSLDFLCQIPQVCTIMANVLKNHVKADDGFKINPLNLTQIYTYLVKGIKPEILAKLKKLAQTCLKAIGRVKSAHDLPCIDISIEQATAFSKECPLVLKVEKGLYDTSRFRFSHSSVQEFFAAFAKMDDIEATSVRSVCCHNLVDQALQSVEGKYDAYLRFIFGLIKERGVLEPTDPLFDYTKKKVLENILSYSSVSLFHCLREYDSQAFLSEVKFYVMNGSSLVSDWSQMHWTIMMQRAKAFEGIREGFELQVPMRCDEKLIRHIPVILKSKKAMLRFSNLTDRSCPALAAILSTKESYLSELDLGYNSISDDGVRILVEGLSDQNCKLKTLRLQGCGVASPACIYLTTALRQSPKLIELDLSRNEIGDAGLQNLADGLKFPDCQLETLKLSQCNIEQEGCHYLASALQKYPCLRVLDLSINMVGDNGANELFKKYDISKLRKLEMYHCGLTERSCEHIGEALKLETSTLLELNLSNNNLTDEGFEHICVGMYGFCSLEKLNVSRCGITGKGCRYLAKVLCSVSQLYSGWIQESDLQAVELKELDLSMNCLGDQGVRDISVGLKNPYSHLQRLNLSHCSLTDECCAELASGLASKESSISELDLSDNDLQDKGVRKLCSGLRSHQCLLEKLSLRTCGLSSRSIQYLTAALNSNPYHLVELHLMGNSLGDSEIRVLMELTKNKKYKLSVIDVSAD